MEISILASGSNGNSCLVETGSCSVLIDAGKSAREIEKRMNKLGKSLSCVDALLVTHSHTDHTRGIDVISRKYDIPVYCSRDVAGMLCLKTNNIKCFSLDRSLKIKSQHIIPVQTSHDVPSCGFVIGKFGVFTDTGIITGQMKKAVEKLNAVLIESNYDYDMLLNGPYPYFLKHRIMSELGHLSNIDAAEFIKSYGKSLTTVFLGHLSATNNSVESVKATYEAIAKQPEYFVCSREDVTGSFSI